MATESKGGLDRTEAEGSRRGGDGDVSGEGDWEEVIFRFLEK